MRQQKGLAVKTALSSLAMAAFLAWAPSVAHAQYQKQNSNGHALDANNQFGSGGINGGSQNSALQTQINNQLIYGNTSGLSAFQGRVPFGDPTQFTGRLPSSPSASLQQIVGPPPTANTSPNTPQLFFNIDRNGVPPPSGVVSIPGSGTYVAAPPPIRQGQDTRLGDLLDAPSIPLPQPGTVSAGPVDAQADITPSFASDLTQTSALYGYRNLELGSNGTSVSYAAATVSPEGAYGEQLSSDDIFRYRAQLSQDLVSSGNALQPQLTPQNGQQSGVNGTQGNSNNSTTPGATNANQDLGAQRLRTPVIGAQRLVPTDLTQSTKLSSAVTSTTLLNGAANTGQYSVTLLPPPPAPEQVTPEYAALKARLQQYNTMHPQSQAEADRIFQEELKLQNAYSKSQTTGGLGTTPTPGVTPTPAPLPEPQPPLNSGANAVAPVAVGPVSTSVKAKGLHDLLSQGEALCKQQKFKEAIDSFNDARAVAPNNPLIWLEEANAELAAGYYGRAENDLRYAFSHDPSLLMATYDVTDLIGDQRLQQLIADLKDIAKQGDSATPVFLLAYLSYNTGDANKALQYLDLAESRANGQDDLIRQLRDHWALPSTRPQ